MLGDPALLGGQLHVIAEDPAQVGIGSDGDGNHDVPFEDIMVSIPVGADAYLRRIFGDYMQLPPEEGRVAKHDVVYANLNEPFEQYKGIHYCVNE